MDIEADSSGRHDASFANQILAEPTKILRDAAEKDDEVFLEAVAELFKLNGGRGRSERIILKN